MIDENLLALFLLVNPASAENIQNYLDEAVHKGLLSRSEADQFFLAENSALVLYRTLTEYRRLCA